MIIGSHPVLRASQTNVSLNKPSVDIQLAEWLEDNSISPRALADFSTILKPYYFVYAYWSYYTVETWNLWNHRREITGAYKSLNITVSV